MRSATSPRCSREAPRDSTNALQARGPSTSSITVIVTIVTTAATISAVRANRDTIERGPATRSNRRPGVMGPMRRSTWNLRSRNASGPPGLNRS